MSNFELLFSVLSSNLFSHITFYVCRYVLVQYVVVLLIALSQLAKTSATSNIFSVSGNKRSVHSRWSSRRRTNKKISSRREEKKEMSSSFSGFGASVAARGRGSSWASSFKRTEGVWCSAPLISKILFWYKIISKAIVKAIASFGDILM